MKAIKIIIAIILILAAVMSIPKLLNSGRGITTLTAPILALIIGIWLLKPSEK
jgi:hypothetical protein